MKKTSQEYDDVIAFCRTLFINKMKDYGSAWRIMRMPSLTDQIFIKAQRIRTLEETGISKVGDGIEGEFVGIINYALMALIQMNLDENTPMELDVEKAMTLYDEQVITTRDLMLQKNHDYS